MKIKKISAIILAGALLASAVGMNAFAADATKPTITVFGNEATPTEVDGTYDFSLRLANFPNNVQGLDIELTSAGAEFTGAANTTRNLVKGTNYIISDNKQTIHIVELTDKITGNETIKLTATVKNAGNITVNVKGLAKDGTTLLKEAEYVLKGMATVAVAPGKTDAPENGNITASDNNKFIPYGYVKKSNGEYATKNPDGNFTDAVVGQYREFNKPAAGEVLTFGVSSATKTNENDALQFGSYTVKGDATGFGTMCIAGKWQDYVDYKIATTGMTVNEILSYISKKYEDNIGEKAFVRINFNNGAGSIKVYKVAQTKYMWENSTDLQYALRVFGLDKGTQYVAVGYSKPDSTTFNFSNELVSAVY